MGIVIKQTAVGDPLPVGEYIAQIAGIEKQPGQYGEQLRFKFQISDGVHAGRSLTGWTSTAFSPKSKLYKWAQAAFGGAVIPATWDFDSDKIVGRSVRLVVVVKLGDDGLEWNKIDDVLPVKRAGAPAASAPPPHATVPAPAGVGWGSDEMPF